MEADCNGSSPEHGTMSFISNLPSRSASNFSNLAPTTSRRTTSSVLNEENKGFAWGTASRQTSIETYVATNDRSLPPQDQVIGTEKVNVLLKHFYGMGEAQRGAGKLDMVGKAKGKKRQTQVQPTAAGRTQKKRK
mmetsp:Transcript_7440/g.26966  ORF Transcript_7440/g.26966 Transcript_7440/m.26966 type:complete len:135 (-) Transcript_7440:279-683(-)